MAGIIVLGRKMKRTFISLVYFFSASVCFAFGWHDYTLDIGEGYSVFRANSMDVSIIKEGHGFILHPDEYDSVGPVVRYVTTAEYIFTKNLGRKPRNKFEGDTFENIDRSAEFFFIISKETDEVIGPLSEDEFKKCPEVASLDNLYWQIPRNPSFWRPLWGDIMFLAYVVWILLFRFLWIVIPVIVVLFIFVRRLVK